MKKIIVAKNSLLKPLYENIFNQNEQISELSETQCIDEIQNGNIDLALVSPLIYAISFGNKNYQIVPSKLLAIENYSNELAIHITQKKKKLTTIFFDEINEFTIVATKILLTERYGIAPKLTNDKANADIIISRKNDFFPDYFALDLTEDWYDTFEIPLIFGFWIVANDKFNANTVSQTNSFFAPTVTNNTINNVQKNCNCDFNDDLHSHCEHDNFERIGYKHWDWDDSFINSLEKIFDLLYYHNFATHIADVKIAGQENS